MQCFLEPSIDVGPPDMEENGIDLRIAPEPRGYKMPRSPIFDRPGILAGKEFFWCIFNISFVLAINCSWICTFLFQISNYLELYVSLFES